MAVWTARADVAAGALGEVPAHLRDATTKAPTALGHGAGYEYPHDHEGGWVAQRYLPESLAGRTWYRPTDHGHEQEVSEMMRRRAAGEVRPVSERVFERANHQARASAHWCTAARSDSSLA